MIPLRFDKDGFPLLKIKSGHLYLWPLTKYQFENIMASINSPPFCDAWYEEVLKLNPRISPHEININNYENIFISGLLPSEVEIILKSFQENIDIPTADEWCEAYNCLAQSDFESLPRYYSQNLAGTIYQALGNILRSPLEFSLMRFGLLEWVRVGHKWGALGEPRPSFHPHLWKPCEEVIYPFLQQRSHLMAVRFLIRTGTP